MQAAVNYKETRTAPFKHARSIKETRAAPFKHASIESVEENWVVSARAHLRSLAHFKNLPY